MRSNKMQIEEVVSIEHEKNGIVEHDGTGFLILLDSAITLVTCRHVIFSHPEKKHFFRFQDMRHEIIVSSDNFLELPENMEPWEAEGVRLDNDMVYFRTAIESEVPLLGSTMEIGEGVELQLIAHSISGKQQMLKGKRRDSNEFVEIHLESAQSIRLLNSICVIFEDAEVGHSGGAVFEPSSGRIVGMLRGNARYFDCTFDSLHMMKAQSIREKYYSIQKGENTKATI